MQFRDLGRQYEALRADIDQAMLSVAQQSRYIMGPQVKELEDALAAYTGVSHCLTCANGTDALTLALKAWGVGQGDAVFVPDFTFFSSAEVVALEGATPVFVDVDDVTFNIDVDSLEKAIEAVRTDGRLRPRVIVAVDLFGLPANFPAVKAVAEKYQLLILEDGAQGFGGSIDGRKACAFGDISTTSFFPAKPLGCYGDGGAVFTDNDEWAQLMASYRVHGKGSDKYDNVRIGMNSRLDTLQAAILLVKLSAFDREVERVNDAACKYTELLKDYVKTPCIPKGFRSSWAQYTIQLKNGTQRIRVQEALKAEGIPTMVYYPKGMSQQTAFQSVCKPGSLNSLLSTPNSQLLSATVLSLPMHPYLENSDIEKVCSVLIAAL